MADKETRHCKRLKKNEKKNHIKLNEKKQKHNKNKHPNHNTFRDINLGAKPGTADFR